MPTPLHWVTTAKGLTAAELTVRAQALAQANPDRLTFETFFRRTPGASMKVKELSQVDFRPIANHRAWGTRGVDLPEYFGSLLEASFLPIANHFEIGEEEMQDLYELYNGNVEVYVQGTLGQQISTKVDNYVKAAKRLQQKQAVEAWLYGRIYVRNQRKQEATITLGFDANRFETAVTAWSDAGVNAYEEMVAFVRRSILAGTNAVGLKLSTKALGHIQADAPRSILNPNEQPGVDTLIDMVKSRLGLGRFGFVTDDTFYHAEDGTQVRYWPESHVAVIPDGIYVGESRYATIVRARQLAAQVPEAKITQDDVAVFYEGENGGKNLSVETQLNAYAWPIERNVFVVNTGIS